MIQTLGLTLPPASGLEIGQVSQPSNLPGPGGSPAPTGDDALTAEVGATGTPIFGGFLRELGEYNADLAWPASYLVYERMRRSDAMVAATLWASKLPIRGGEWTVIAPADATPVEKEATEFIEDELINGEVDFDRALENALLMLDFGASMHEDVWAIDGGRVHLKKLAERLPLTFYRWICDPGTDNLRVIEQLGYRAGNYVRTELPLTKCTLFTFRQEGANFTGRSLLREMYQHWYIKSGLYKVDAIGCERNGMGVPVITMGPDAKTEDRVTALEWVQRLTTHERTGLLLPPGWTFALEGVKGTLRDPKEAIQHHDVKIALVGLAQFMMMGQSSRGSGNRSLGETMSDFFFMGLQATANQIGRRFSDTTVRRLVEFNFGDDVRHPQLVPQQIMALKFESIVDGLAKLGTANLVTDDMELEDWLRKRMGAPDKPAGLRAAAHAVVGPDGKTGDDGGGAAAAAGGAENAKNGANSGEGGGKVAATDLSPEVGAAGDLGGGAGSPVLNLRRAPRGVEKHLALTEIVGALDQGRDEIAGALRAARPRVQAEIVHKLLNKPVREMHTASVPADGKLIGQVEGILRGIAEFGRKQVGEERARQRAGARPGDAATIRMDARAKRDPLGVYADGIVGEFQNTVSARATNAMVARRVRGDATAGELIQGVEEDLDGQSDKWIDGLGSKGANEAFAAGRADGFAEYRDEIARYIYSALLDINTCEFCAGADGQEGESEDDIPAVPNPDCDGGDRCRCVVVAVFEDEKGGNEK